MFVLSEDIGETRARIRARSLHVHILSAGFGRGPLVIGYDDINDLMKREDAGEFNVLDMTVQHEFKIGDLVVIIGGALADHRGAVIKRLNGAGYQIGVGNLKIMAKAEHLRLANGESESS
jgi:hypothetical protein